MSSFRVTEAYSNRAMFVGTFSISLLMGFLLPESLLPMSWAWAASILLRAVWAGIVLGVDLMEAWVKFRSDLVAQDKTGYGRVVAFGIGRIIFATNNRLEIWLCGLAFFFHMHSGAPLASLVVVIPIFILVLQSFWLQAELDAHGRDIVKKYLKDYEEAKKTNTPITLKPVRTTKSAIEHGIVGTLVLLKVALLLFGCFQDLLAAKA